jgi:tripartite-type tricarboxylate transporter receptor subunit TctC
LTFEETTMRRAFAFLCSLAASAAFALSAGAADFPGKTVTVVVSGPAGGPLDAVTRMVFDKARERLGSQPIVIENKAGAGGILAVTTVTQAQPDGHTLLSTIDPPIVATPSLVANVPYDPLKDLVPVAMLGDGGDNLLVVPADSPVKNVQELVAWVRAHPDQANYSSSGNGGPGHLLGELFNRQTRTHALHIPHKGSPDAFNAIIAGRVTFGFVPAGLAAPQVKAGKVRALAVASKERSPLLPELPTVAEGGVKDFQPVHWWIIAFAPANTPRDVVEKLNHAIVAAAQAPQAAELLRKQGLRPSQDAPAQVAERVRNDVGYWTRVIRELGIKAG